MDSQENFNWLLTEPSEIILDYFRKNKIPLERPVPFLFTVNERKYNSRKMIFNHTVIRMLINQGRLEVIKDLWNEILHKKTVIRILLSLCLPTNNIGTVPLREPSSNQIIGDIFHFLKYFIEETVRVHPDMIDELLYISIRKGNIEIVNLIIDLGGDINKIVDDKSGNVSLPINISCQRGDFEMTKFLLEKGSKITIDDYVFNCDQPLTSACHGGNLEIVKLLIELGADPDPRVGYSPIRAACYSGHCHIIEELLYRGVLIPEDYHVDKEDYGGRIVEVLENFKIVNLNMKPSKK